jgi:hypothetical protein
MEEMVFPPLKIGMWLKGNIVMQAYLLLFWKVVVLLPALLQDPRKEIVC